MDPNKEIYKDLICPICTKELRLVEDETPNNNIGKKLSLMCGSWKNVYPVLAHVPCFVSHVNTLSKTAISFGFEWKAFWKGLFDKTNVFGLDLRNTKDYFLNSLGLTVGDLTSAKILDAG